MTLSRDDLVLSTGVIGNPAIEVVCDAAVAGGYAGVATWPHDFLKHQGDGRTIAEYRDRLHDAGLVLDHVDAVFAWSQVHSNPRLRAIEENRWLDLTVELGARCLGAHPQLLMPDASEVADRFAELCERARERDLLIGLEPAPWTGVSIPSIALDIFERAGRPSNAGVVLDSWHVFRGCVEMDFIAAIPGASIGGIQLSDGTEFSPVWADWALLDETMRSRLLPGDGFFDLVGFIRALDAAGADVPILVEVLNDELRTLPPDEIARRTGDASRRVIAQARETVRS